MHWLKSFLAVPNTTDPNERQRLESFLRGILRFALVVTVLATILLVSQGNGQGQIVLINGILFGAILGAFYLQRRGLLRRAGLVVILVFWVYLTFSLFGFGGLHNPISAGFLLLILVAGTLLDRAGVVLGSALSVASTLWVALVEQSGQLPPDLVKLSPFQHWISLSTVLIGSGVVMYLWQRSIQGAMGRARTELGERVRAEAALRQSEGKMRSLLAAIPDIIIIFSAQGVAQEVFTSRPEEMSVMGDEIIGHSIHELMPPHVSKRIQAVIDRAISGNTVEEFQYHMVNPVGDFWFEARVSSYQANGETLALWLARNITRQKNAEEEIRRFNVELEGRVHERTAELESAVAELEAFTYTVSHDLRSPLRGISGFSGILLNDFSQYLPVPGQEFLRKIQQNTRKMGTLVDDLLEFSRLGRKQVAKSETDLAQLSREVLQDLEHELSGRPVEIFIQNMPHLFCDPDLMKRVMFNLLSNALKFTRTKTDARVEIGSILRDNRVAYFVSDNGVGFDMAYAGKIFGVFQRLHEDSQFEGTGVGLAIVQRIIVKHGGQVWADAVEGQGATFYFTLA